jgi:hypothetical protein
MHEFVILSIKGFLQLFLHVKKLNISVGQLRIVADTKGIKEPDVTT